MNDQLLHRCVVRLPRAAQCFVRAPLRTGDDRRHGPVLNRAERERFLGEVDERHAAAQATDIRRRCRDDTRGRAELQRGSPTDAVAAVVRHGSPRPAPPPGARVFTWKHRQPRPLSAEERCTTGSGSANDRKRLPMCYKAAVPVPARSSARTPTVAIDVTPLVGTRSGIGAAVAEIVTAL